MNCFKNLNHIVKFGSEIRCNGIVFFPQTKCFKRTRNSCKESFRDLLSLLRRFKRFCYRYFRT